MNTAEQNDKGAWLDNLDALMDGEPLSGADEELLHVATRLASALAPLRERARAGKGRRADTFTYARIKASSVRHYRSTFIPRPALLVVILFLFLLAAGISGGGMQAVWNTANSAWHASTSFDQLQGVSITSLARPHAGLRPLPLLPTTLPRDTQLSAYGVITDQANPNILTTFVADYRIAGQEVLLYEQPADVPLASPGSPSVQIGAYSGQLFQDEAGNHALQWYQNGMLCQITSKLSTTRLIALAGDFQPIRSWDLLR